MAADAAGAAGPRRAALRGGAAPAGRHAARCRPAGCADGLAELVAADDGPPLAATLQRRADLAQFREFVAHRSVYHLREADPHSWALPRLGGPAKAALVEIQTDEYGNGRLERMHAELFRPRSTAWAWTPATAPTWTWCPP